MQVSVFPTAIISYELAGKFTEKLQLKNVEKKLFKNSLCFMQNTIKKHNMKS